MARVFKLGDAERIGLPGRSALEVVGAAGGARAVTLRLVEIPVARPEETPRGPHLHRDFEECIHVLSGETILIPAGERHVTRNTGSAPLVLLCFFPINDIRPGTEEATFGSPN